MNTISRGFDIVDKESSIKYLLRPQIRVHRVDIALHHQFLCLIDGVELLHDIRYSDWRFHCSFQYRLRCELEEVVVVDPIRIDTTPLQHLRIVSFCHKVLSDQTDKLQPVVTGLEAESFPDLSRLVMSE